MHLLEQLSNCFADSTEESLKKNEFFRILLKTLIILYYFTFGIFYEFYFHLKFPAIFKLIFIFYF